MKVKIEIDDNGNFYIAISIHEHYFDLVSDIKVANILNLSLEDYRNILIEYGANIHAQDDCALRVAYYCGYTEILELLKSYIITHT